MQLIEKILSLFNPGFASIAGDDWYRITHKFKKSVVYLLVGLGVCGLLIFVSPPIENVFVPWVITTSFALIAFGGLLFLSGVRDFIESKFPGYFGAFLWILVLPILLSIPVLIILYFCG